MKYKDTPIIGDKKYAAYYNFNPYFLSKEISDAINSFHRQALHSYRLSFTHPQSRKLMDFVIPIDHSIQRILDLLTIDNI